MGPYRILLDCGLKDITPLQSAASGRPPADLVLCSHAHADHAEGLLALHRAFPQMPVYASEVTSQLLPLNWPQEDREDLPLFCQALPWRTPVEFLDGLSAEIWPAGHLPGAALICLTYTAIDRPYTLVYTGDFFLSNSRLVEGLPLEELRGLEPDVLIVEGSYGTARYPHRRQQENQLAERLSRALSERQSVVLPTPTLGLGQELLMLLRSHHHFTGRDLDIWVDGTVAAGCEAYLELLPHFPATVQNFARHQPLFWDERIKPRVRRLRPEHRETIGQTPCIILTDFASDYSTYCQPDTGPWLILLPQSPGHDITTGDLPSDGGTGLRPPVVVETYLLSQHSDGAGTTQLIHNLRPQHVVFFHGSETYLTDLTGLEELQNRYHLHSPHTGTRVELPIGETFLQPAAPETSYEGELNELGTVVTITLPDAITANPRWRRLADTGLVEARWQGDELVLRGIQQQEFLSQGGDRVLNWSETTVREGCGICRHYRSQRCWNPGSPLFNFKVTPDGYCPAFEVLPTIEQPPFPEAER